MAEFKVAQWKGADSLRQRGLVADLVGLALDKTVGDGSYSSWARFHATSCRPADEPS